MVIPVNQESGLITVQYMTWILAPEDISDVEHPSRSELQHAISIVERDEDFIKFEVLLAAPGDSKWPTIFARWGCVKHRTWSWRLKRHWNMRPLPSSDGLRVQSLWCQVVISSADVSTRVDCGESWATEETSIVWSSPVKLIIRRTVYILRLQSTEEADYT